MQMTITVCVYERECSSDFYDTSAARRRKHKLFKSRLAMILSRD